MKAKDYLVSLLMLVLGLILFSILGGLKLSVVYLMLWIDKVIIGKLKIPLEFGIELFSIPAIIVGISYGPAVGFFFGFLLIPLIGGILDITISMVSGAHLLDTGSEPLLPSMQSIITGIIAAIAGFLNPLIPFFFIVLVCVIVRFVINIIKDIIMGEPPKIIAYTVNLGLNIAIAFFLQEIFVALLV